MEEICVFHSPCDFHSQLVFMVAGKLLKSSVGPGLVLIAVIDQ